MATHSVRRDGRRGRCGCRPCRGAPRTRRSGLWSTVAKCDTVPMRRNCGSKRKPPVSVGERALQSLALARAAAPARRRRRWRRGGWRRSAEPVAPCWRDQLAADRQRGSAGAPCSQRIDWPSGMSRAQRHLEEQVRHQRRRALDRCARRNASISSRSARHCSGVPTIGEAKQLQHARAGCAASALCDQRRDAPVRRTQGGRQQRPRWSGSAGSSRPGSGCRRAPDARVSSAGSAGRTRPWPVIGSGMGRLIADRLSRIAKSDQAPATRPNPIGDHARH